MWVCGLVTLLCCLLCKLCATILIFHWPPPYCCCCHIGHAVYNKYTDTRSVHWPPLVAFAFAISYFQQHRRRIGRRVPFDYCSRRRRRTNDARCGGAAALNVRQSSIIWALLFSHHHSSSETPSGGDPNDGSSSTRQIDFTKKNIEHNECLPVRKID